MRRVLSLMVVLVLLTPAQPVSGQIPNTPEAAAMQVRVEAAYTAWAAAKTNAEREDVRSRFGPFDKEFLSAADDKGEDLQKRGEYPLAISYFEFIKTVTDPADNLWVSIAWQLIAGTERLMGRYADAEAHYRIALDYAHKPGADKRIPIVTSNMAGVYVTQARYAEGLALLQQAIDYDEEHGITDDAALLQNTAIVYGMTGDYARSLENFLKALQIYEKKNDTRKVALAHYNIGILQSKQGNSEAAVLEMETAYAMVEKAGDRTQMAMILGDLGRVRDLQGRPKEALETMNKALALAKEIGFRAAYSDDLLDLGNFHLNHNDLPQAEARFKEVLQVWEELHDDGNRELALRGLGATARKRGDFAALAGYASEALETALRIGDIEGEWQARALTGVAWRARGDAAKSREEYNKAIAIVERARGLVGGGDVEKQRFFEQAVYPYQELAGLEYEAHNPLASLQAAERARARVLLDILESGPSQIDRQMTDAERAEETQLRAEIAVLNTRVARAKPAEQQELSRAREEAWHRWELFLSALYLKHPALRNWRGESPVINESDLSAVLPDARSATVEYLSSQDETLVFVAMLDAATHKPQVVAHRIAMGREELGRRAEHYRSTLESRDPGFREEARGLYRLLLGPLAAELKGRTRIALVPDGPLWQLPFQTLIAPSGHYWIEDATLSWAPSITFLRDQALAPVAPRTFSKDLLAMADPTRPDTASIPVLRDQARRIAALYDPLRTTIQTGAQAGEAAFKSDAPSARVIHIAAHGTVDQKNGLHSRLLLAPSSTTSAGKEDGWLEAWELMRMNLPADLVILSACETGRGEAAAGEGLVGLTWALFVSGVHSAIVSQWRVESESTTELMVELHRNLRRGDRPADALRSSILTLMKKEPYRHPMYWGAFVSAGL